MTFLFNVTKSQIVRVTVCHYKRFIKIRNVTKEI